MVTKTPYSSSKIHKEAIRTKMVTLTDAAKEQISTALSKKEGKTALRVEVTTNGTSEFSYSLKLISLDEKTPEDVTVEGGEFQIVVAPKSAEYLKGTTIDLSLIHI